MWQVKMDPQNNQLPNLPFQINHLFCHSYKILTYTSQFTEKELPTRKLHLPLPYRLYRYILRQLLQQPFGHVLVSSFVQPAFWHFSAETESSAAHEPCLKTEVEALE
jgi:hypothetical protein